VDKYLKEQQIIPYHISPPYGKRVLVLAPHPDDETFGCGGTIRLLIEAHKDVKVIFLTSGDKADPKDPSSKVAHEKKHITDYSLMREKEAQKALSILGVTDYEFLRFPDRGLAGHYGDVLKKLREITNDYLPDAIYSPSMAELNPDHRSASALSMELQREQLNIRGKHPIKVVFYEVTVPLRPNMLIDITRAYKVKIKAVRKYISQSRLIDYQRHVTALNTVRSLTVGGEGFAEAFWVISGGLSEEDINGWLSYRDAINAD